MNKRPLIGIISLFDDEKNSMWILPEYTKGIEVAGGVPFLLPLTKDKTIIEHYLILMDGFLFTGGQDVNPQLYREERKDYTDKPCDLRDYMESYIFKRAVEIDKPIFGICRGVQLINVLCGGSLYQDINTEMERDFKIQHRQEKPYNICSHNVKINENSKLFKILNKENLGVNTLHHQGIKVLGDGLIISAVSDDGLIEAIEVKNKNFILAVQWHPELSYETNEDSMKLLEYFVNVCK